MPDKIKPLADVLPVYERDLSTYPDVIRVAMDDGKVVNYRIDIQQPHPAFVSAMDTLAKMPVYGGYKYTPKHKKESLWTRIQRLKAQKG